MEWTKVYISSVTNAMRGKALLERQGFAVHMQRSSHAKETDGCGYSLLVRGEVGPITALLSKAGIRVLRIEHGGVRR